MSEGDLKGFIEVDDPELIPIEVKVTINPYDFLAAEHAHVCGSNLLRQWCQGQVDDACSEVLRATTIAVGYIEPDGDAVLEIHCWDEAVERGTLFSALGTYVREIHAAYLWANDKGPDDEASEASRDARAALRRLADGLERQATAIRGLLDG